MHGLISTYNYLISSCAYPGWAWHKIMDVQIVNRSLNPVFNESFIFDLPTKDGSLGDVQLEVRAPINIVKLKVLVKSMIRTMSNKI